MDDSDENAVFLWNYYGMMDIILVRSVDNSMFEVLFEGSGSNMEETSQFSDEP